MKLCPTCHKLYYGEDQERCSQDGAVLLDVGPLEHRSGDSLLGQVLSDKYFVRSILGSGAMGTVYRALQVVINRDVAIKVLNRSMATDPAFAERFTREVRALSQLNHPNVVSIMDQGYTSDGLLYMVQELLDGESLEDLIHREGPFAPPRAILIAKQIAKALMEAHTKGVIHRDLKADNVFVITYPGERDFIKVLDFGLAKFTASEDMSGRITQTGAIFGTPRYMAPEQARGLEQDGRSDIYALGVILYEMLNGEVPFSGDDVFTVLEKQVRAQPPPLRDKSLPPSLVDLTFRALAKGADKRPQSAAEVFRALEEVEGHLRPAHLRVRRSRGLLTHAATALIGGLLGLGASSLLIKPPAAPPPALLLAAHTPIVEPLTLPPQDAGPPDVAFLAPPDLPQDISASDVPADAPPRAKPPSRQTYRRSLQTLRQAMATAGLLARDAPDLDRLVDQAKKLASAGKIAQANATLAQAQALVEGLPIDQGLVKAKFDRLSLAINRAALPPEQKEVLNALASEILDHYMAGRYQRMNRAMNRAFTMLAQGKKGP